MKLLYTPAVILLALLILSDGASAQTYTAVRSRDWHVPSGVNAWDLNGEPPATCSNCVITINSGVTVTLNTSVTLTNSSTLVIGSDPGLGSARLIIPASGATDWTGSNTVILDNDGSTPANIIRLLSGGSIDATGTAPGASYDGIITVYNGSTPATYSKLLGNGASVFSGTTVINNSPPSNPNPLIGPATLSSDGILPIKLAGFEARLGKNVVNLDWTTVLEANSDHFAVERSTDGGSHWQTLGTVAARGFSSVAVNYSFTDQSPATGVSQYRLQLVDRDGKYAYSPIKVVRSGLISGVSVFPNPAKDYVNISLGSEAVANLSIRLVNQSGQVLIEKKLSNAAGTTLSLPVNSYPTGNYLVLVTGADGSQQISKLFISRQ